MDNIDTQQVAKNVKKLAKIASMLDSFQPEIASEIDKISENYFGLMKEAQYVGVQGYALRNRRCFDNCLRQKRAKSDKPYEEIWNDCHQEYLKAMSDEGSDTWNKYASVQDKNTRNIIAKRDESGASNPGYHLNINSGKLEALLHDGSGPSVTIGPGGTAIDSNDWNYVVGAFDRSGNAVLYVNGAVDNTTDISHRIYS